MNANDLDMNASFLLCSVRSAKTSSGCLPEEGTKGMGYCSKELELMMKTQFQCLTILSLVSHSSKLI